jgi:microbial collagenase
MNFSNHAQSQQHKLSQLRQLKQAAFVLLLITASHSSFAQTKPTITSNQATPISSTATTTATSKVEDILIRNHTCSNSLSVRSQALKPEQEQAICQQLGQLEAQFHERFAGKGKQLKPVLHDNNASLRANIYRDQASFAQYAGTHFNMPTNNGGMYLEGLPEQSGNHAEFVAYQRAQGQVHNLGHEYIHYLDGRFNLFGDFCATLHDSHSPPENCPLPSPDAPYLVWWTEGIAEYMAHGQHHPNAQKAAKQKTYLLSQLFETAYEKNNDSARIYTWGYLATRYMMEQHRNKIDAMLKLTRNGDYPRYQALIRTWGTSLDTDFELWLEKLGVEGDGGKP